MLLHLLENGESSLKIGLEFYEKYLTQDFTVSEVEYYGKLKFAIIGIQNSIELFIKKLLSEVDDLLIYDQDTIDNPDVLNYIGRMYKDKQKINLDYFMATYGENFTTISYSRCLARLKACFNITDYNIGVLQKVNSYRNVLTHFGLEDIYGQDKMVYTLNESLVIIRDILIPYINLKREKVDKEWSDLITDFLKSNEDNFYEVWEASNEYNIEWYNGRLDELLTNDTKIESIVGTKEEFVYEENNIILNGKSRKITLEITDIPEKNISVIGYNKKVLAIMDYDLFAGEKDTGFVYCPKKDEEIEQLIRTKKCTWRNSNNCPYNRIPLEINSFIKNIVEKAISINDSSVEN
ncbi:hypothetical protein lbkm_0603 [Lachnospiraceae bacterium KM106-2]|nr:hypothetical protein lbkm_0603 [Lachnospiraceae bacterium KM106-2]